MSFTGYVCWKQKDALKLLATEALEGDNSLFLATHHPLPGFKVAGSHGTLVHEHNESGLLAALTHDENRHVFCVVEGDPGSGKSHLIRWLHVMWPDRDKRDLVLLIQRTDGSLEGTLQSLRDALPESYRPIFEGLGRLSDRTEDGRRKDFQTKLANSMERAYFPQPPEDAEWCAQRGISQVLNHEKVKDLWGAPRRLLAILAGKGSYGEVRDQELARFTLGDVIEIAQMQRAVIGVPVAAGRWLRELKKETDELEGLLATTSEDDIVATDPQRFPESCGFLSALNQRLNNAIQELLGSTARQLDELFKKLRRQLQTQKRRLVLLLEDVTSFQGVDEKLLDALVFNADTHQDNAYCDLISVLGVTPDYFRRYIQTKSNYAQRVTQHIQLNIGSDVRPDEFAVPFAVRYLRAIRAGQERLKGFDGQGQIFNRCEGCPHRIACHQAFGHHDGVGLYPFTGQSIQGMFSELHDPSNVSTQQTPRGLIQNILNPTLQHPSALEQGAYPSATCETAYLPRRALDGRLRAIIEQQDEKYREPLRILLSWWGKALSPEGSKVDERGNPLFEGVPRGVFAAFGLPWPGESGAMATTPLDHPDSDGVAPALPSIDIPVDVPKATAAVPLARPVVSRPEGIQRGESRTGTRWELNASQLARRREQLGQWDKSGGLEDGESFWNKWLHRLVVQEVPWRRLGISPWLQATLFTEQNVMIAETKQSRSSHFVLERSAWLRDGMEAFITLQTRPLPETDLDFYRYRLVRMVHKLEAAVVHHVEKALALEAEAFWSPVALVVQVALVRAWLRGTLRPGMALVDQWEYLFTPEPTAEAAPKKRVESWVKLSGRTSVFPEELRKRLPHMVNQPNAGSVPATYGECELAMADPSEAIPAMRTLMGNLEFSAFPTSMNRPWDRFIETSLQTAADLNTLPQVSLREGRRMLDLALELEGASPGESIQEYIRRVDGALLKVSGVIRSVPNEAIQGWTQLLAEARRGLLAPGAQGRVDRVDEFKVEGSLKKLEEFSSPSQCLDWSIQLPADDISEASELVRQAESSLSRVLGHVQDVLREVESVGGSSLQDFQDAGAELAASCGSLLGAIREPG